MLGGKEKCIFQDWLLKSVELIVFLLNSAYTDTPL